MIVSPAQQEVEIVKGMGSGYRISCGSCLRAGKKAEYEGETGANGFTRGNEQLSGLRSKDPENALWKHCMLEHESEQADFCLNLFNLRWQGK